MHPKNPHAGRYDLSALAKTSPELIRFIVPSKGGGTTINFDEPNAVRVLNAALLKHHYGINFWQLPEKFLCPPIPGRADYIHTLADLFPNPKNLKGIDVGTGASAIFPLIGFKAYNWSIVGSDIDPQALASAEKIVKQNKLEAAIELRLQTDSKRIFEHIIRPAEKYDFTLCNPPFHASAAEAQESAERKRKNLGLGKGKLNFGGQSHELWCPGGERAFIKVMIDESVKYAKQVTWFSTLVSKEINLPMLEQKLKSVKCPKIKVLPLSHGQKKSRILAWSFQ